MSSQPKHGKHAKGSQEAKSSQVAQPSQQQASATPGSSAKTQVFQAGKGSSASAQAPSASTHANTKVLNALPAIEADKTLPIDTETPWEEGANGEGKTRWAGDAYPENTQVVGEDAADFSSALNSMPADFSGVKKKKRSKKTVAIVLGVIVAVIVVAYGVGVGVFSNYFFPNTKLGPVDASMKSNAQVEEELSNSIASYTITASGAGFTYTASAKDAGLTVDAQQIVQRAHEELPAWQWPYLLVKSYQQRNDVSDALASTYDSAGLAENIKQAVAQFNQTATAPQNATIAYDAVANVFKVKSEVAGTALNADQVVKEIDQGLADMEDRVSLSDECLQKPAVLSDDPRLAAALTSANNMVKADLKLTMGGFNAGEVDSDSIAPLITLDENLQVKLDEDALSAYAESVADSLNTVGSERTYTRPDGKVITVSGGEYGWEVDVDDLSQQIVEGVKNATVSTIEVPTISQGDTYAGVGQRDWGNRYIDVDLAEQHVYMYDASGALIWESDCISGKPDGEHDTSLGVYILGSKKSPSKLIGYQGNTKIYESEVQYWMPFDGNAIGLHDAPWQPGFGGTMYADGYGSHGCVNLPSDAAAELYSLVEDGDIVVSHF